MYQRIEDREGLDRTFTVWLLLNYSNFSVRHFSFSIWGTLKALKAIFFFFTLIDGERSIKQLGWWEGSLYSTDIYPLEAVMVQCKMS